ncbi:putative phosphoenolpyruvate carboxylase [Helianthus annuus]|nr:putative phosphoenolpyruvate carboxylase [Helianthus annuus]KAJ0626619.1 putative phosphoenolpyruvate carboxylase [Helianthus annuus]
MSSQNWSRLPVWATYPLFITHRPLLPLFHPTPPSLPPLTRSIVTFPMILLTLNVVKIAKKVKRWLRRESLQGRSLIQDFDQQSSASIPRLNSVLCFLPAHSGFFLEPLELCYRSLCACGDRVMADRSLLDFLRQVSTFGVSLVKLDIRQESERHTDVLCYIPWCNCINLYIMF